ncbi:MAG: helix-turn-helix transcriptional regulator [Verrucomicrobiota bacterium]
MKKRVISEDDARAMVRLLGEVAAVEGSHSDKKRHLMDGLCELIQADAWAWSLGTRLAPHQMQSFFRFLHGGFDEERFSRLLTLIEHPQIRGIAEAFYREVGSQESITMLRDEIDLKGLCDSQSLQRFWEEANVRSMMLSGHPIDDTSVSCIAVYRQFSDRSFSEREKQIAHIVLTEVPWLHLSGWPEDRGATVPHLFPRQRMVLNLLLDGLSRKAIANRIGISESTVAGYTKEIYRHFSVNSQVGLVRKFYT